VAGLECVGGARHGQGSVGNCHQKQVLTSRDVVKAMILCTIFQQKDGKDNLMK
jgi:hypothetical protein